MVRASSYPSGEPNSRRVAPDHGTGGQVAEVEMTLGGIGQMANGEEFPGRESDNLIWKVGVDGGAGRRGREYLMDHLQGIGIDDGDKRGIGADYDLRAVGGF